MTWTREQGREYLREWRKSHTTRLESAIMCEITETLLGLTCEGTLKQIKFNSPDRSTPKNRVVHSHCLMCGRIHYRVFVEQCPRCGGRCNHIRDNEMQKLGRYSGIE